MISRDQARYRFGIKLHRKNPRISLGKNEAKCESGKRGNSEGVDAEVRASGSLLVLLMHRGRRP